MQDGTARTVTAYASVLVAIFATLDFILGYVLPYVKGQQVSAVTPIATVVILALVGVLLGWYTNPAKRVASYLAKRRNVTRGPAPADLARDVVAHWETARRIWSSGHDQFIGSLNYASMQVLNKLASGNPPLTPNGQIFLNQAHGVINGWRMSGPLQEYLIRDIEAGIQLYSKDMDGDTLILLLQGILQFALVGSNTANFFAQSASSTGFHFESYVIDEWRAFADAANRLSQDVATLGTKVNKFYNLSDSYYIPPVKGSL